MATRIGLEPTTPSVTGWCSNQLSYRAMIAQVSSGVLTAGTCDYYTGEVILLSSVKFRKTRQKFQKVRHLSEKGKNKTPELPEEFSVR